MRKSEVFLFCSLSFIFGIGLALLREINFLIVYVFLLLAIIFLVIFWKNLNLRILTFGILFLFVAILRVDISESNLFMRGKDELPYRLFNGEEVIMYGIVNDEPIITYNAQKLEFKVEKFFQARDWIAGENKVLVNTKLYPSYSYGDRLEISCKLKEPKPFDNFQYDKYLALSGTYAICYYPKIKILSQNQGNKFYSAILAFKSKLQSIIYENINEPQASILEAILLGNKYGINQDLKTSFSRAGISHIIAISGMHIAILAVIILLFFNFIGISRKKAANLSILVIFLYVIMIGAPLSAIRAAVMAFLVILAIQIGRITKFLNILFFTASIMLFFSPGILLYDLSFQFSFAAILGICFLYSIIKKFIRIPINQYLKDLISISLAAEIFIFPLVAYYFGFVSLASLFANLLVIWLVPVIMFLGLFFLFLGFISLYLSVVSFLRAIIGFFIEFLIKYIIAVAQLFGSSKWMVLDIKSFSLWEVFICYLFIAALIIGLKYYKFLDT